MGATRKGRYSGLRFFCSLVLYRFLFVLGPRSRRGIGPLRSGPLFLLARGTGPEPACDPGALRAPSELEAAARPPASAGKGPGSRGTPAPGFAFWGVLFCAWLATSAPGPRLSPSPSCLPTEGRRAVG